jgi:hypothetical protein
VQAQLVQLLLRPALGAGRRRGHPVSVAVSKRLPTGRRGVPAGLLRAARLLRAVGVRREVGIGRTHGGVSLRT